MSFPGQFSIITNACVRKLHDHAQPFYIKQLQKTDDFIFGSGTSGVEIHAEEMEGANDYLTTFQNSPI